MSTNSDGNKAELLAQGWLEQQGYIVHRAQRVYRYTGPARPPLMVNCDVFGAFDLIAVKPGERIRFIQVTTGSRIGEKKAQVNLVPIPPEHGTVEVWEWMARKMEKGMTRAEWKDWQFFRVRTKEAGFLLESAIEVRP